MLERNYEKLKTAEKNILTWVGKLVKILYKKSDSSFHSGLTDPKLSFITLGCC